MPTVSAAYENASVVSKNIESSAPMISALQIIGGKNEKTGKLLILILPSSCVSIAASKVAAEPKKISKNKYKS